jgi:hypothetical protein
MTDETRKFVQMRSILKFSYALDLLNTIHFVLWNGKKIVMLYLVGSSFGQMSRNFAMDVLVGAFFLGLYE